MDQDIHPQRRHCLQLLAGLGLTASSAHLRIAAATQAQAQEQGPAHGQAQTPGKEQEQRQGQKQGQEQARLQGRAQRQGQTQEPATASGEVIVARFGGRTGLPAPEHIRRVFAAGPPAGVLVAVLAQENLLGWPTPLADGARALLGPALRNLPVTGRLAGRGNTVPLEALIEQAPDLVLDAGTADATYVSGMRRVSEQTGLPTVLIQGRIGEQAAQLREVGHLLGATERGAQLAGEAQHFIDLTTRIRSAIPPAQRPRVYFGRGTDGLETARPGSINAELLDFCGGHNVAASMKQGSLARVSMEQLLQWDPQVIVTQDAAFARRVRTDPLWRDISAVRTGRVHCAPALPFGWLDSPPGVNRLIGIRWLLEHLHPGHPALRGQNPLPQTVQHFFRLFYGHPLPAADAQRLLAGSWTPA